MKKQFVQPTFDNVLVKKDEAVKEIGGIIVPDHSQEKPAEGVIVAIGPKILSSARAISESKILFPADSEAEKRDNWLAEQQTFDLGDKVVFGKYSGIDITLDDGTPNAQTFTKLRQDEIQAVIVSFEVPDEPKESEGVAVEDLAAFAPKE